MYARFEEEIFDPIIYAYKENCSLLSTDTLKENGWVSANAQSSITVENDEEHGNYVFFNPAASTRNMKLTSTASSKTMPWIINGDAENTVTLEQIMRTPVWAHLKLTVDPETGTAELIITQNGEGKYNGAVDMSAAEGNYAAAGLNFNAVKTYSKCQFDNVKVYLASQVEQ